MFPGTYFPAAYFAPRYFPEAASAPRVKPPYFYHGYFPRTFFADRYFPGLDAPGITPPPPAVVIPGGRRWRRPIHSHEEPHPPRIPSVDGLVSLELPRLQIRAYGSVAPADIAARLHLLLAAPTWRPIMGEATPADLYSATQATARYWASILRAAQGAVDVDDEDE